MADTRSPRGDGKAAHEVRLSRTLGPFTVTMMGVGGMIGAGIFALTGLAAGRAGPAVILVFVLNGFVTLLTAFAYAELGSAFPRAGGGYIWVKEALGGANGFLGGWMSWFGYIVAGALYGITFGGFAADAWSAAGLPSGGLAPSQLATAFMVVVILALTAFNVGGAEETGVMGNVITVLKIAILGLFVAFGLAVMLRSGTWEHRFLADFMPNGVGGVLAAMGLTFIAFEGYEIIAQSGEEIKDPKRNIPRGIFISVAIAVAIYVLVGIVAIGATTAPAGLSVSAFLGGEKELAIVSVARQIFPFGTGGALMLLSGLAATMSALNVTIYSASRVSFAMGRENNLPAVLARIHPRRRTPYVSVLVTGAFMLVAGLLMPIGTAATAGGIMFLLMFIQVNLAVMIMRHDRPEVRRGFTVPLFPLPMLIAIAANAALVLYVITYNPTAVWTAFGWIVLGLLAYYMYFERLESMEKPKAVVHEEAVGTYDYTVLVAVREEREAEILGWFGAAVAKARQGGLLALHMSEVPRVMSLAASRHLLDTGRGYFETVRDQARARGIATHTIIMMARRGAAAVTEIAQERRADFIVLGWTGKTKRGRIFGRTTDPLLANPPADLAILRPARRKVGAVETILVPVSAGRNSRFAVELASDIGRVVAGRKHARITLFRVARTKAEEAAAAEDTALFDGLRDGITYGQITTKTALGTSVANAIIAEAEDYDLVILGAGEEAMFERILSGNIAKRVLREAKPTTVLVKRREPALQSLLRRTVLAPRAVKRPPRR